MVDSSSATLPPTMKKSDYSRISAQEHPTLIGGNTSGRKLLVLDLNGTICHRIANPTTETNDATSSPPSSSASSSHFSTPSSGSSTAHDVIPKSTRTSHPRPYMPTLLSYLFHPTTKEWLTTIAWSTSKVSSVAEMIEKCFGFDESSHVSEDRKGKRKAYAKELAAIWTRESVEGESKQDKKQKKKAEKDLGRIWGWEESGGVPTSSLPLPHSIPLSSTPSTSKSKLDGFSQLDTILLDDTPSKAAHQPYNYVPIAKYTKERLLVDYTICGRTLINDAEGDDPLGDSPIPTEPSSPLGGTVPLPDDSTPPPVIVPPPPAGTKYTTAVGEEEPDPSLFAVIGILAELRGVENVSWWIREGGLVDVPSLGGHPKEGEKEERPWYAIPEVLQYWVARGRKKVNSLGLSMVIYDAEGEHTPIEEDFLSPTTHLPSSSSSSSSTSSYSPAFSTYSGHSASTSTSVSTSVSECTPPLTLPPPLERSPASAGSGITVRPGVGTKGGVGALDEGEGEVRKTVLVKAS